MGIKEIESFMINQIKCDKLQRSNNLLESWNWPGVFKQGSKISGKFRKNTNNKKIYVNSTIKNTSKVL